MARLRMAKSRQVRCIHCGASNEVAQRAMSIFCMYCHKRLILEDYVIKSFQGLKGYSTCGNVVVEKGGQVVAFVQANNLDVRGILRGNAEVLGRVEVASTGFLQGDVCAPALTVEEGAQFKGFCRIGPRLTTQRAPQSDSQGNSLPSTPLQEGSSRLSKGLERQAGGNKPEADEKKTAAQTGAAPPVRAVKAISTRRKSR